MELRSTGPTPAKIMIVADYPGESDMAQRTPLAGYAGQEFTKMLFEAMIVRSHCFITCAVKHDIGEMGSVVAMKKKDITDDMQMVRDRYVKPVVVESMKVLQAEIELVQPNLILAVGDLALWMLTGETGVFKWRGSEMKTDLTLALPYIPKVVPVLHPRTVMKAWSWRRVVVHDLKRANRWAAQKEIIPENYNFIIRPNYSQVCHVLNELQTQVESFAAPLSVDIETRAGQIACIGLAWSKSDALCIPLMCIEREKGYWTEEEEANIHHALYKLLTHKNCLVVGQGFQYDIQYFARRMAFLPNLARDTMITQHALFSNMKKSLDFQASMYCEHYTYWKDEGKTWDKDMDEDQLWRYNCEDAVRTYEINTVTQGLTDSFKMRDVVDFQQSLFPTITKTTLRGIKVDRNRRSMFRDELITAIETRNKELEYMVGMPVNIKSPKQMSELFYDILKQKGIKSKGSEGLTCDNEALGIIATRTPALRRLVKTIKELRSLSVFLSTFIEAPLDWDGRMRCRLNITGTETFRFSSTKNDFGTGMNMQNIPSGGDDEDFSLPNVRSIFVPDSSMTMFDIDLDSADLRIVAWEAGLEEMKAMLAEGKKVYVEVMKEYYRDPTLTKNHAQYTTFKSLCHGTHYLGTVAGLSSRLGLLRAEVEKLRKWYYGKFPGLLKWQNDVKARLDSQKMVTNIFGYRTFFFDRIEGTVYNQAIAWIPQSTVAILINKAFKEIEDKIPEAEVLLQVHDSLMGQYPTHLADVIKPKIVQVAQIPLPYADPTFIPVGIKTSEVSWGDCK